MANHKRKVLATHTLHTEDGKGMRYDLVEGGIVCVTGLLSGLSVDVRTSFLNSSIREALGLTPLTVSEGHA